MEKVSGFGTYGVLVMTGRKEVPTGYLMRLNSAILNIHCIAPRLALCSCQLASPLIVYLIWRTTQEIIFGYSACSTIQEVGRPGRWSQGHSGAAGWARKANMQKYKSGGSLSIRQLKPYSVRWTHWSHTWLSQMISYPRLCSPKLRHEFSTTKHLMVDISPTIMAPCLVFQKKELDVALVPISIQNYLNALHSHLENKVQRTTHTKTLPDELKPIAGCRYEFKGHSIINFMLLSMRRKLKKNHKPTF